MAYQHDRDLHLTYEHDRGYWHFVLYVEPPADAGTAINAGKSFDAATSRYAKEWLGRLDSCDPDALHVAIVGSKDARSLWDSCVYDDPSSPSAIAGDGCVCWRPLRDPVTWLPVAAHHFRTVAGNIENWTHHTFAPLQLPVNERLSTLILDHDAGMEWLRTEDGSLHILPERSGRGYSSGYSGGGPAALSEMIEQIAESDGYDVSATEPPHSKAMNEKIFAWVSSKSAGHTQELTLAQLKTLCRTGMVG